MTHNLTLADGKPIADCLFIVMLHNLILCTAFPTRAMDEAGGTLTTSQATRQTNIIIAKCLN